ncbi:ATPase [Croceicoccus ponticola]|uniref:ATPase n=1 Tax=Croceicoccus ponticola TaxID=2217664 RepID=A0A437GVP4_9SPHN|nr:SRPBCC domain-containing protein [Croceicoccus ponticola]RVQ65970.1 ATPase [Croceicoccus ponticola]
MHELKVTRLIAAPVERCWDVLANRQEEWWCPAPWRIEMIEQDRRPGGRSAMMMLGPDGEKMPQDGIFLAWDEGRRFVVTDAISLMGGDYEPADPFMIGTWEVVPEGDGTRYNASARHWTEEAMNNHAEMGFDDGWGAVADQFKAMCEG